MSFHDPLTLKLSLREKFAYGVGDFGSNLMLCIGTLYLLKFYTDELGMPAYYGGIIFLVAKFFTAFTDMLTGVLLDSRRNIGAKGKFRPFILYASFPVAVVASAQFLATDFTLTVKTGLATVLFMLFGLFYSLMNCSYGAMVPAITKNPHERAQLAAWRQGGATVGLLLCTVGFMPIQALFVSSSSLGYLIAALIFSVCGLFSMWWCFSGVKERYIEIVPDHHKPSILKSFCAIFRNPPLLVLCVANLCTLAAFNIKLAIQVYYTQYVLNDIHLLSWMGFFSMGCILVDYGEWKTGIRAEGSVYTGYTFSRKISAALAGFLPGIMLTQIGYIPNITQSNATLLGLRQLIFLWPCGLAIIAAFTMGLFYKLNETRFAFIIEEISQRKKNNNLSNPVTTKNNTSAVNV